MMAVELISRRRSADATGPWGSSTPVCAQDATGTPALTTSQRSHPEPLTEGLQYKGRYKQSLGPRLLNHAIEFSWAFASAPSAPDSLRLDRHRGEADGAPGDRTEFVLPILRVSMDGKTS